MSMQVDGQSCVPPGFRFHPTEEELLNYYLRKKVAAEDIDLDVIRDVDLNKLEPWDIQEKCRIGSTPQNDWYLFSHKDKKYPTGTRTNRATAAGFWKATGRDKVIYSSCRRIGMRKTLVFYKGRAPHGQKSDWIMHEYRLDDHSVDLIPQSDVISSTTAEAANQEDGWVVCRVFKKKSFHCKAMDSTSMMHGTKTQLLHSASDDGLDQILQYIGRSCKQEGRAIADGNCNTSAAHNIVQERFLRLPSLECTTYSQLPPCGYHTSYVPEPIHAVVSDDRSDLAAGGADWAAFDRLLASQLDGQSTEQTALQGQFFDDHVFTFCSSDNEYKHGSDNGDLWSFTRSARSASMDRMGQVSI